MTQTKCFYIVIQKFQHLYTWEHNNKNKLFCTYILGDVNNAKNKHIIDASGPLYTNGWLVGFMVFSATFNNISVISLRSVSLVVETGVPGEYHRPVANHWQTFYHIMLYRVHPAWTRFVLTTLVVICTDCTDSCKFYHTITTTMASCNIYI